MDSSYSVRPWYGNKEILTAVNRCMDVIEQADLSAEQAENIPDYLAEAIERSNQLLYQMPNFRQRILGWKSKTGHMKLR